MSPVIPPAGNLRAGGDEVRGPAPPPSDNQLLAGYLAHEFLTRGTLFGRRFQTAEAEETRPAKKARLEAGENAAGEKSEVYVEVASLLGDDGAHLPDMTTKNMIGNLSTNEKLDGTNYESWHRKIQYVFNEREILETLSTTVAEPKDTDSDQYKENLVAYQEWSKKDRSARYTMLCCMDNDLIGDFDSCPTAKDMWDKLKVTFGSDQTSATRLPLNLKWMQYDMDSNHSVPEHFRVTSALIHDLRAVGREISNEEQVLNVIPSLPNEPDSWVNINLLLAHSEHINTFKEIARHLEMEIERQKALGFSNVAFVAQVEKPKGNKPNRGKHSKKGKCPSQTNGPKGGITKQHKGDGLREKKISRMQCYNCRRKGHLAQDCPEPKQGGITKQHKPEGRREKKIARMKCYNCGKKGHFAQDCPEPKQTREEANM